MKIQRYPLLTTHEVRGFYRYGDLFQLVPADSSDPRPDSLIGWYGMTLEIVIDPVATQRLTDTWAHDHRERQRIKELSNKAKTAGKEWLDTDTRIRERRRLQAIVHELVRLLSILTNYRFKEPLLEEHVWVLDNSKKHTARWAQTWYPSFATGPTDSFTPMSSQRIALIDPSDYYSRRLGYGPGEPIIELPSDIDHQLDIYFDLRPKKKIAMARAAELHGVAQDIWSSSRSVSLTAGVFAVETLIHADDPSPQKCEECQALLSTEKCGACGAPRYRITRRFRDFVNRYVESDDASTKRLYEARSAIVHSGRLLRDDEFDSGFNVGGNDDESELANVTLLVRSILRRWLNDQKTSDE